MDEYQTVLRTPELGPGRIAEVRAHGRSLALANVGQTYYALAAECPEDGTNLATEGMLSGDLLVCPHDRAAFDVRDGRRAAPDSAATLQRYAIRVVGNEIQVGPPLEPRS